jgi:hypothetical protein
MQAPLTTPLESTVPNQDGVPDFMATLQALRDKLAAAQTEEKEELARHTQEMANIATRKGRYQTALNVLTEMYPVSGEPKPQNATLILSPSGTDKPRKLRTEPGTLKRAINALFVKRDNFLLVKDIKKHPSLAGFSEARITEGLKQGRKPGGGLIGVSVYNGAFPMIINGLPTFFEEDGKTPKSVYAEKLKSRLAELGLTLEPAMKK